FALVLLDPTCTLPGLLKGDRFYRNRSTTYWRKALLDSDPVVHVATVSALKEGGATAVPVLVELLPPGQNSKAEVRWLAADILWEFGPDAAAALPALLAALGDPDAHVRHVVITALGEVGPPSPEVVAALTERLETDERVAAARALARFRKGATPAVPALRR